MKKITLLVIAILLFTVVFAAENPVRIFAKNRESSGNDPCIGEQNLEACYRKHCAIAVNCGVECSGNELVSIDICVKQSMKADFLCVDRLTGITSAEGEFCADEKIRDASPEDCEAEGFTNCDPNGIYYIAIPKACQPDYRISPNPLTPYMVCSPVDQKPVIYGCNSQQCDISTETCDCVSSPHAEGYCSGWIIEEQESKYVIYTDELVNYDENAEYCSDTCDVTQDGDVGRKCVDRCTQAGNFYCCEVGGKVRFNEWKAVYVDEHGDVETPNPCNAECGAKVTATCPSDKVCDPCEPSSSCPYLYSVTENGLKLEEDIIVAQLFKFMEEPFYTKLNNYDSSIGKLVIYEHLDELSHINQIELIKVEHSDNSEALIDSAGNIHTIKNPEKVRCVDNLGNDCTSMIEKEDAKLSIESRETEFGELDYEVIIDSKSYGKEAWAQTTDGLSYMELEFPKNEKESGKLVVAFSYSGKSDVYEEIYKKLAKVDKLLISLSLIDNPIVENIFKEKYKDYFYRRIVIEYLDNGIWKYYPNKEDYNLHTLPYKKTVVPLDLSIIKENKIRITQRESFVYDYIAVDFSDNEILSKEIVPLLSYDVLLHHDDNELLLQRDEFIELEFEKSDVEASYFLKSVGYYQPGVKK